MHFGRVLGRVVATRKVTPLVGVRLLWVQPTTARGEPTGEPLVAADTRGYSEAEWVYFVTSREASLPLPDPYVPVDATIVGKVDCVSLDGEGSRFGRDDAR